MSTVSRYGRSDLRRSRALCAIARACVVALLPALAMSEVQAAAECEPFKWMRERLDFNAAKDQRRVRSIESFHFDADVESLIRGTTGSVGSDTDFLVRYVPNHHRGLTALVRLALRDKTPQPRGVQISVECYLLRALEFKPSDVEVQKLYATYLARLGRNDEALVWFDQVEKLAPDDAVVAYNMGLLLTEKGEYERARAYAKRAYAGGLDFPGLRDKLARQGEWR